MRIQIASALSLSAVLALPATALADGAWEIVAVAGGSAPTAVPGIPDAVWIPNEFNNPTVGSDGSVIFRGRFGGPGITTANSRGIFKFTNGVATLIAREGSPLPGDLIPGAVINTASGVSGLSSANIITRNGGIVVAGSANGGGVTPNNNDFNVFVPVTGAPSMIGREGDPYPGAAGVTMTVGQLTSSSYVNDGGKAFASATLAGAGVITTSGITQNNNALVLLSPAGTEVVFRRGDAAPGAGAGGHWDIPAGAIMQPDTSGLFMNGDRIAFSGRLFGDPAIDLTRDNVYLTNAFAAPGQLRIIARDGSEVPGFPGITFQQVSNFAGPIAWRQPIAADGTIVFFTRFGGAVTTGVDDAAFMSERDGVYQMLIRRGQALPGITDGTVFQSPNTGSISMNQAGLLVYQGILMNTDGSAATNATYVAARKPDGTHIMIIRQGDAVPGVPGVTADNLNGSTSATVSESGVAVFRIDLSDGGVAIGAWDESAGLRVIAKTGDTQFTGTPANQFALLSSSNGDGGAMALSTSGVLTCRISDSVNSVHTICKIQLGDEGSSCPADLDDDGDVDGTDLATLLAQWGTNGSADINGDGTVNATDLSSVLAAWGNCS